ncbi:MAG: Spi family protease inhibitor [Muribaculaceae bacterium]|nr:Spi family protease inhibitor [Muribaculaceae bacterium]
MTRYIKALIVLVAVALSSSVGKGETVSQKEASRTAQLFFNTLYGEVTAPVKLVWNGRQLTTDRLFSPFYVYNSPKGGSVIISAENKGYPVLLYSGINHFSRENLGEVENNLLKKYAKEIELIRYDSRVPTSALDSWQNLPSYFSRIIDDPYNTSEYRNLSLDKKEILEEIDRRNGWIAMPSAVEFTLYDPADYRDLTLDDILEEEEEIPFSFYETFIAEIRREALMREMAFEEILSPSRPIIKDLGGSHFEITFPEDIKMMRIYALTGAKSAERYFGDTAVANIDLSALAPGFYIGMALADSGEIYSFKLYR